MKNNQIYRFLKGGILGYCVGTFTFAFILSLINGLLITAAIAVGGIAFLSSWLFFPVPSIFVFLTGGFGLIYSLDKNLDWKRLILVGVLGGLVTGIMLSIESNKIVTPSNSRLELFSIAGLISGLVASTLIGLEYIPKISKWHFFLVGGIIGYLVSAFLIGLDHIVASNFHYLPVWLIPLVSVLGFFIYGSITLILVKLKKMKSPVFWPLALILGANIGTLIGAGFLIHLKLSILDSHQLHFALAGVITNAIVGLFVWFKSPK